MYVVFVSTICNRLKFPILCNTSFGPLVTYLFYRNLLPAVRPARCYLLFTCFVSGALNMASSKVSLSEEYEDGSVYQVPFVAESTAALVKHKGFWHGRFLFPDLQRFEQVRQFTLNSDDILIVSYPKSGSIAHFIRPPDTLVGGLRFYRDSSSSIFFLFSSPTSELAERNSTEIGHMLGSKCDLKMHVQNLGISSPYKSEAS